MSWYSGNRECGGDCGTMVMLAAEIFVMLVKVVSGDRDGDGGDGDGGGDGEPAFCHRLFCLHMTTVPGSWEVLQWDSFEMWYLPFLKIYIIIMILPGFMLEQWDSKRRTIVMPEQLMYKKAPDCKRWRIFI